jgi:polar amino acid transport system substrate-binding protein
MRHVAALSALACAIVLLAGCQGPARSGSQASRTLTEIRERGVLRVGISEFVPWAMEDRHGKLIGFEADVAGRLARDMAVRAELVKLPWQELIPALTAGRIDVIVSGMSITPERALRVNFSLPYHRSHVTLVASLANAGGLSERTDFDEPEMKIGYVAGTTAEDAAEWAFEHAEHVRFANERETLAAVRTGRVHAVLASSPGPQFAVLRFPEELYLPLESYVARTAEAFAVRQGEHDLLAFLNAWIQFHRTDRWLERRRAYWFLGLDWESRL